MLVYNANEQLGHKETQNVKFEKKKIRTFNVGDKACSEREKIEE